MPTPSSRRHGSRRSAFGAAFAVAALWGLSASAADESPGLGEPVSPATLAALDITVMADGSGLPAGEGSVAQGLAVYESQCAACHGSDGTGGPNDALAGGRGTLASDLPVRTVGSFWPYAPTLFDYIRRAMPYASPGSLSDAEVYALTAYVLHLNGLLADDAVLDAASLAALPMPNREGFRRAEN